MHDLLTDPLIGVRTPQGERYLNLPELLAALSAGKVEGYTGLRPHQADHWHVFLVQLAASIQARHLTDSLAEDPVYWRDGLLDLADGMDTAWHLMVEDVTKPAFLQHPWRSWDSEAGDYGVKIKRGQETFEPKASTPDELDVLVTSKNHDIKMARVTAQALDAWIFALVLLQTTSGFLGQGNYGIVRMNGGFASRSVVSWARSLNPSIRFMDEVAMLVDMREQVCTTFHYQPRGTVLTWLTRWDRSSHHHYLNQLEPWFIEAARPIRLRVGSDGTLVALGATSKSRQIGPASIDNGNIGDPWTPVNVEDKKKGRSALTLPADGFSPQRLTDLLFRQGFELTFLQEPKPGGAPGWFVASCLVRGQGTTEGFHRIELPVPPKARLALFNKQNRDTLGHFAQDLLSDAKNVQRALNTALTVMTEGGPDSADFDRDAIKRWVESFRAAFGQRWEASYFPILWRGADEEHETVRASWRHLLVNEAQALLDEAIMSLPIPSNRIWRAITKAQSALNGALRKNGLPLPGRTPDESTAREVTAL